MRNLSSPDTRYPAVPPRWVLIYFDVASMPLYLRATGEEMAPRRKNLRELKSSVGIPLTQKGLRLDVLRFSLVDTQIT
uniref:Uncharacterized protein n=1 Tax=Candidatus Kentrum sp. SD TaxID=2126332 RepID=A0A451BQM7_9GAMM|nr:MAG: hypothetical protein BECKSD772D_GA0070982_11292 [Candidatus Kentron sp. SD]